MSAPLVVALVFLMVICAGAACGAVAWFIATVADRSWGDDQH